MSIRQLKLLAEAQEKVEAARVLETYNATLLAIANAFAGRDTYVKRAIEKLTKLAE